MEKTKNFFTELNSIDVSKWIEKKNGLSYLSWANAWAEFKKRFPDAVYQIFSDEQHRPYFEDTDFGLMCYTSVTANGITHEMWLPVMDGANKAMKRQPYTYKVWDRYNNKWQEKQVAAATMFDINKTIMRCLVKNLAMFGLGLYIYAGEDLPESDGDAPAPPVAVAPAQAPQPAKTDNGASDEELQAAFEMIKANIENASSRQYLNDLHKQNVALHNYVPYKEAMNKRYKEVK